MEPMNHFCQTPVEEILNSFPEEETITAINSILVNNNDIMDSHCALSDIQFNSSASVDLADHQDDCVMDNWEENETSQGMDQCSPSSDLEGSAEDNVESLELRSVLP